MTILGEEIIACSHCGKAYRQPIIGSFNTFLATFYSDGYLEGSGIPNFVPVVKCAKCSAFFLRHKAQVIGEMMEGEDKEQYPKEWKNAANLREYRITAPELEEALSSDFGREGKNEYTLRYQLLHAYNHAWRNREAPSKGNQLENAGFMANAVRLIDMLEKKEDPDQLLFIADLYRQTGNFEKCLSILEGMWNLPKGEKRKQLEQIYSQAKIKDPMVLDFDFTAVKKEYSCSRCGESIFLFDLDKIISSLDFRHFRCIPENRVFNASMLKSNPLPYYSSSIFKRLFRRKKAWQQFVPAGKIHCPHCKTDRVEPFSTSQKCIYCGKGRYRAVKWFQWLN